jgi:hypothetical protein
MNEQLELKIREIIWRRWSAEGYPTVDETHPPVFTGEIYDELIKSGVNVPWGMMESILKVWMSQGYIRTRAVGGSSEDKRLHGSMQIVAVYETLINPH